VDGADPGRGLQVETGGRQLVVFEQRLHIAHTTTGERLARSSCPPRSSGPSDARDHGGEPSSSGGRNVTRISDAGDRG
jgi:hypothetical protein